MLFHIFNSQEERKKYGGSDFIELQYCGLEKGTAIEDIVSADKIKHWQNDSLYIFGDDINLFYKHYGGIVTGGTYSNQKCGPVDMCGINFFTKEQTSLIIKRLDDEKPHEYKILADWLKKGEKYIGFYVLGE